MTWYAKSFSVVAMELPSSAKIALRLKSRRLPSTGRHTNLNRKAVVIGETV